MKRLLLLCLLLATPALADDRHLAWDYAPEELPSIATFRIYRDGIMRGTSTTQTYTDTVKLTIGSHKYYVTAFSKKGVESGPSNILEVIAAPPPTVTPAPISTLVPPTNLR